MVEIFSQVWVWIASFVGGISVAGIISAIIYGCLKGAFNRTISRINVQKIADQATEKGIEKVRKVSFTHTIQPLVESELVKINEKSTEVLKNELAVVSSKYDKVVLILEKLSAYFDNSIGVSESAKTELKKAILDAKEEEIAPAESIVVEETTKTEAKVENLDIKKPAKVER